MSNKVFLFVADAGSIHTAKWVDYFVGKGHEVHLATFAKNNITLCENIYFLSGFEPSRSGGNYHYLLGIKPLSAIIKRIKPDVINAHFSYSYGLVTYLASKFSKSNSNLSVVCHGSDVLAPPLPSIINRINRFVLNRVDRVFVVSDQIKDRVERLGVNPLNLFIGQYGVGSVDIVVEKDIDIISNRAYIPNSRIDFLLDNISNLDLLDRKVVFVVPHISEEEFETIKLKYPNVIFYKALDYKEMQELVGRSKLYVSATQSDGTSLSLLEALNLGCVPLISNIVSNRSWVLDGINGYLFNSDKEFKNKLKILLNKEDLNEARFLNHQIIDSRGRYSVQMRKIEKFLLNSE
jgi:glycosyltransferase involved in cell wall biosynthesis